ncbi:MAG TPA: glycosyltransferase family 1 protein [Candidatus Saccharimonadales bacterium]|nr:glycosyltransferase family 1 protein [Candidatus Saccharimonadales bacterium]
MKIGIDISQIIYGTGVSHYTRELVGRLLQMDGGDQYILFGGSLRRQAELKKYTEKVFPISPTFADLIWNRFHVLGIERLIGKVDVFHSSDWSQPPSSAFKVTTVHDLAAIKFPDETPRKVIEVHRRRLYWVVREADRIIVPTNAVKEDLMQIGADEKRIRVIYEGVSEIFKKRDKESVSAVKRKFGIHEDYIMMVGVGLRKNTKNVIEAFQKTKDVRKLVIVGGKKIDSDIRGVVYTGYVSDDDLVSLYSGARALVYPSLYEGYGLPILQAFACELPVVTSNTGSMKEVAGDAAVLVNPNDVSSITEGINKALIGPKGLIKKGIKRVSDFSWDTCAKETLKVYKESGK